MRARSRESGSEPGRRGRFARHVSQEEIRVGTRRGNAARRRAVGSRGRRLFVVGRLDDPRARRVDARAVRGLPGDGSDGDASPSSRSLPGASTAPRPPRRGRTRCPPTGGAGTAEALSARMLNEETGETREAAAREARHREEQDRKRAGVLASLPSALASRLRRGGRKPGKPPSARSARGDGGSSAEDASDLGFRASAFAPHVSDETWQTRQPPRAHTALSRVGPHPCERKRAEGEERPAACRGSALALHGASPRARPRARAPRGRLRRSAVTGSRFTRFTTRARSRSPHRKTAWSLCPGCWSAEWW